MTGKRSKQAGRLLKDNGFDTSAIVGKLDGINSGICSLGYDQLAQMNSVNQNVSTTGFGIQNAITQMGIANMQDTNSLCSLLIAAARIGSLLHRFAMTWRRMLAQSRLLSTKWASRSYRTIMRITVL